MPYVPIEERAERTYSVFFQVPGKEVDSKSVIAKNAQQAQSIIQNAYPTANVGWAKLTKTADETPSQHYRVTFREPNAEPQIEVIPASSKKDAGVRLKDKYPNVLIVSILHVD